jgi:hypothetical protein
MRPDALVNLRRVSLDPAEDFRVIHVKPALTHHLLDITVRELAAAVNGLVVAHFKERAGDLL